MAQKPDLSQILPIEERISGPFMLFNNSFIIEYLNPHPARNASVLMHARYVATHPEVKLGKKYGQTPPLHLHFSQAESFIVLQGRIGTTTGWECRDRVWTSSNGVQTIEQWKVHSFWPVPPDEYPDSAEEGKEDCRILVWAHPKLPGMDNVSDGMFPPSMDHLFFHSILGYISDTHEGKKKLDIGLIMLMQHKSETAPIMLPMWTYLGPLRWWLPWKIQGFLAAIAQWQGKTPVLEEYVGKTEFEKWSRAQKKLKET